MLRRTATILTVQLRQWIPDPFVFAIVLTLAVGVLAWGLTDSSGGEVLDAWFQGFWILLEFGMQMALVLATGYAIALSPVATRAIDTLAARVSSPGQVYVLVLLVGALCTLVSLQPFFLLVILPVMGAGVRIQARDVMGYLVIPFVAMYVVTAAIVTWIPI